MPPLYTSVTGYSTAKLQTFLQNWKTFKFSPVQVLHNTVVRCGCCNVFTSNKLNAIHVAMPSFHCRHPTVPTCGGSGPCLSGGKLSGVCWQRQVHILKANIYTHVNRMSHSSLLALFAVVGLCCRTIVTGHNVVHYTTVCRHFL